MRWIVRSSLHFRFIVVAVAVGMVAFGATRVSNMPVDVFPEFAPPFVEVQTEGLGMSTQEVEQLITIPMEQTLNSTPGLDTMRSATVPGLSAITLIFRRGTDPLEARQLVNERVATAIPSLPSSAGIPWTLQPLSATSRALKIGITCDHCNLTDLSMIAYWTIRWRLMAVPGVANVVIWGDRWQQLQYQLDPEKLRAHGITVDHAMSVTSDALDFGLLKYTDAAKNRVGGFIETPNQRLGIHHVLPVFTPAELGKVTVSGKYRADGSPLQLADLGTPTWGHQPLFGDAVINDHQGLLMVVEKFPWANTLDVTRGIDQALDEMRPGLPGIHMDNHIFRPAEFIEISISNLSDALLLGTLFVVVVLVAFLFEWRAALISLAAIPLSLMAAALVLYATGATINTMVLAGFVISVGVVVDDAIIDIENIVRRLRQNRASEAPRPVMSVVLDASLEVRRAIVYATLIIVLAVVPVFFITSVSGAFFRPLVSSYGLAVLASMVVALTVTPALALLLLGRAPLDERQPPLVRALQRAYTAALARVVRTPTVVLAATAATLVAGVAATPYLGESLFPTFKERDFLALWVTRPGTGHQEVVRIVERASRDLRSIPGVRGFGAHIGRAVQGEEVNGINFAENWISLSPHADYDKTLARIRGTVAAYPGLFREQTTYLNERIDEVLAGSSEAITVRIFGPSLEVLREKAHQVHAALRGIPGIVDLRTELQVDVPYIRVKPDLEKAAKYGLKPGDIRREAATIVAGDEVSDLHVDGKVYDVMVWSVPKARRDVQSIRDLLLDTPGGGHVRMAEVADVSVQPTPNRISREDNSRRIDVGMNVRGRDLGSVVADVKKRLATVKFPHEYHAEVLGEFAERAAAQGRLLAFGAAAALGILLLLQTCIGSWRVATFSFLTLPLALVGGVLAAFAAGGVISLGSLVGFLTVFGIAARNGILLINHYQHLEREEEEPFGLELVLRGSRERLAPILMTALATGLALVPLVMSGEIPGAEIEYPMAIVILGGLATSTLLNLFLVPTLYLRFAGPPAAPQVADGRPG
ncbi:MAG TPA: efflux RND transporter permease subunit [Gaiellales bacterium]|nr:efflux RND transporter permease subunit [Gaiellales bacterium]